MKHLVKDDSTTSVACGLSIESLDDWDDYCLIEESSPSDDSVCMLCLSKLLPVESDNLNAQKLIKSWKNEKENQSH